LIPTKEIYYNSQFIERLLNCDRMNIEEKQIFLSIEASKEDEILRQAIKDSNEAEILRQAIKDSEDLTNDIPKIRKKFLEYTRATSENEEFNLKQIQNDILSDSSEGIIIDIIHHGIRNKAYLVRNNDNTVSVVPLFEIEEINGENRSNLIPSKGDSVVWKKKYITDSGGGGPVFQYPHGNFWRSTPYGYRWTDSNGIEHSRLYLS
jgi:hypothetical protein